MFLTDDLESGVSCYRSVSPEPLPDVVMAVAGAGSPSASNSDEMALKLDQLEFDRFSYRVRLVFSHCLIIGPILLILSWIAVLRSRARNGTVLYVGNIAAAQAICFASTCVLHGAGVLSLDISSIDICRWSVLAYETAGHVECAFFMLLFLDLMYCRDMPTKQCRVWTKKLVLGATTMTWCVCILMAVPVGVSAIVVPASGFSSSHCDVPESHGVLRMTLRICFGFAVPGVLTASAALEAMYARRDQQTRSLLSRILAYYFTYICIHAPFQIVRAGRASMSGTATKVPLLDYLDVSFESLTMMNLLAGPVFMWLIGCPSPGEDVKRSFGWAVGLSSSLGKKFPASKIDELCREAIQQAKVAVVGMKGPDQKPVMQEEEPVDGHATDVAENEKADHGCES